MHKARLLPCTNESILTDESLPFKTTRAICKSKMNNRTFFSTSLDQHLTKIRFLIVGAWNTLVGWLLFVLFEMICSRVFNTRYVSYMTAMVLANVFSILNAYMCHRYFTFKSEKRGREMVAEFIKFCTTNAAVFVANIVLLPFFVELVGLPPRIAAGFVISLCTVISYLGHSRFSFKRKHDNQ